MSGMRTIDIDFDVHKRIETNRESFEESPNDVLRRLLGLVGRPSEGKPTGKAYVFEKMELPHGTEARMTYNNVRYDARIEDGWWVAGGERHKSPSGAASALAVTKSGGKTNLDGWKYWEVRRPGSTDWVPIWTVWEQSKKGKA